MGPIQRSKRLATFWYLDRVVGISRKVTSPVRVFGMSDNGASWLPVMIAAFVGHYSSTPEKKDGPGTPASPSGTIQSDSLQRRSSSQEMPEHRTLERVHSI